MIAVVEKTWLTREQAVELICERYNTSTGKAEAVVRDAFKSDEVRNTLVDDDALSLLGFDKTEIPPPGLNKADLVDWLDRNPPAKRAPAVKKDRHYVSAANIPEIVSQYLATATAPSMAKLVSHVRELGLNAARPKLREEYRNQRGNLRPGRPSK